MEVITNMLVDSDTIEAYAEESEKRCHPTRDLCVETY